VSGIFEWPLRVYYEDTDAGGVVYHSQYLNFMERARTEWLRAKGFEQDALAREDGVVFVVRRAEVDYRRSARFNDALSVSVELAEKRRTNLTLSQSIRRTLDGELLVQGRVQVACVDFRAFRPRPIPQRIAREMV
jgi:acyl-CoA thioester hydrolase